MTLRKKIFIAVPILAAALYLGAGLFMGHSIDTYKRVTFDDVLKNPERRAHYGIAGAEDPSGYGFINCKTIQYYSEADRIKLSAWYIPSTATGSGRCLLMYNGRDDNRLKALKFMPLLKEKKAESVYSICIADLRNSGESEKGRSAMGLKTSEDIYYTIKHLSRTYNLKHFTLYTFSMGAMSTSVMLNNKAFMDDLSASGITIDKIVFDSPLSNVYETLFTAGTRIKHIPSFLMKTGLYFFDRKINGYLAQMRLSVLYKNIRIPLLIVAAEDDPKTPYPVLAKELALLQNSAVHAEIFKKGQHIQIIQQPENADRYTNLVGDFLMRK